MTYRVVDLGSKEAGDSRLGATPAERLSILAELSRTAWLASGRELPSYTRATMPVRLLTLRELAPARDR
jgi:hypothetical protein